MSLLQQQRRRAREIALQLLYALDFRNDQTPDEAMALFPFDGESEEVVNYAIWLVKGIWGKRVEIDNLIRMHITGWRPERMVTVDLEAIRLALFEGVYSKVVPIPVAISEAIELAKRFGTENSGRFVNGVLGKIVRSIAEVEGMAKMSREMPLLNNLPKTSNVISVDELTLYIKDLIEKDPILRNVAVKGEIIEIKDIIAATYIFRSGASNPDYLA